MNIAGSKYLYQIHSPQGELKGYLLGSVHKVYQSTIEKVIPVVKPLLQECSHFAAEVLEFELPAEYRKQMSLAQYRMLKDFDEATLNQGFEVLIARVDKLSKKKIEQKFYEWFSAVLKMLNKQMKELENVASKEKVPGIYQSEIDELYSKAEINTADELENCKREIDQFYSNAENKLNEHFLDHDRSPFCTTKTLAGNFLELVNKLRTLTTETKPYYNFEACILNEAKHLQLIALETYEEHSFGLDDSTIANEVERLTHFIRNPNKKTLQDLIFDKSIIDKWENNEVTEEDISGSSDKESLDTRSIIQANSIHKFISTNQTKLFSVVGTAHLFGHNGVVEQLRAKGWTVNLVNSKS